MHLILSLLSTASSCYSKELEINNIIILLVYVFNCTDQKVST